MTPEAAFHTAVSGTAINNLAKTFMLNFLRALQTSEICLQTQQHCVTMPCLGVNNFPSDKGTKIKIRLKSVVQTHTCFTIKTHRFKSWELFMLTKLPITSWISP